MLIRFSVIALLFTSVAFFLMPEPAPANLSATYKTFTEYHHDCNGTSGSGATCSGNCADACSCSCSSGFWTCTCSCDCPDEASVKPIKQSLTIPPVQTWETFEQVLAQDGSKIARKVNRRLAKLRQMGEKNQVDAYNKLAKKLDEEMMQLNPKTLEKLLASI